MEFPETPEGHTLGGNRGIRHLTGMAIDTVKGAKIEFAEEGKTEVTPVGQEGHGNRVAFHIDEHLPLSKDKPPCRAGPLNRRMYRGDKETFHCVKGTRYIIQSQQGRTWLSFGDPVLRMSLLSDHFSQFLVQRPTVFLYIYY